MRASLVSLLLVFTACRFDVSGQATGGDDDAAAIDGAAAAIDAAHAADGAILPAPADAGPQMPPVQCGNQICGGTTICCTDWINGQACTTPDACNGSTQACDGASDCPGQQCCMYAGWSSCGDSCIGGDTVCQDSTECGGGGAICCDAQGNGPNTCHSFCF